MSGLMTAALKDNHNLRLGMITGVMRTARESIFSKLNNLIVADLYSQEYCQYFGFTEQEVEDLAKSYEASDKMSEIRNWYDGYRIGNLSIYNPWSILHYFRKKCTPEDYWTNTGSTDLIYLLLKKAGYQAKNTFFKLLNGQEVEIKLQKSIVYKDLKTKSTALWSLIVSTGYLTLKNMDLGTSTFSLKIPNEEVRLSLENLLLTWLEDELGLADLYIYTINLFLNNDIEGFEHTLNTKFFISFSYSNEGPHQRPEAYFHGFLHCLAFILSNKYEILSSEKFGHGDPDLVFYRKDQSGPGFILECKIAENEAGVKSKMKEAKTQVLMKNYSFGFKKLNITEYRVYGIVFQKDKTKCHIQLLEESPLQTSQV
jgi:hypothetical protein